MVSCGKASRASSEGIYLAGALQRVTKVQPHDVSPGLLSQIGKALKGTLGDHVANCSESTQLKRGCTSPDLRAG